MAAELGKRNEPAQTPSTSSSSAQVARYADPQTEVTVEPTLPADPAAKQSAIDAELNRAVKRAIDVEVNRAINRAPSYAQDDRKHYSDQ